MLAHLPRRVGRSLSNVRPGPQKALHALAAANVAEDITLTSPAFATGGTLPIRYTSDGAGLSPPLTWSDIPVAARALLLVIEDVDSPTPKPLVHAIVELPDGGLPEGALPSRASRGGGRLGLNSYLRRSYMSPDPPPGHGPHQYVFQVFALREPVDARLGGRRQVGALVRDYAVAKGVLTASYERV